ncbi:MAG: ATP-binding cassette domain-containing protein [Candidatus Marsarchaeota archaeon]
MLFIHPSFLKGELALDEGEVVGLLGKSGSGKTRLITEALGWGGNCAIREEGSRLDLPLPRSLLSGVLQDPSSQVLGGNCQEEIRLLAADHAVDEAMAKKLMGEYYSRDFFELSDGYKRRYSLVTVMASKPKYILLDEPLANLDSQGVREILSLLPRGSLIAEHRVREVRGILDRAYLIANNNIEEVGRDKLYDDEFLRSHGLRGFKLERQKESVVGNEVLLDLDVGFRLTLKEGEVVGLYGRNASGKTTIIRKLSRKSYAVFQEPDLQFFRRTVSEEVGNDDALALFGLSKKADSSPFALSFGEKMRVLMAAAFSSGKRVLAFDEPTTGMDGDALLSFLDALDLLRDQKRGVVMATHDEDLLSVCDRVIFLQ